MLAASLGRRLTGGTHPTVTLDYLKTEYVPSAEKPNQKNPPDQATRQCRKKGQRWETLALTCQLQMEKLEGFNLSMRGHSKAFAGRKKILAALSPAGPISLWRVRDSCRLPC